MQDTLLRAWRSIGWFDGRHPRAWLLTIMRDAEVNRHRRRRPVLLDDPNEQTGRSRSEDPAGASAEDVVVDRLFDDVVEGALAELPDGFREVVVLVDVDGLTYAEAAEVLQVPEGTVMSRLHRAPHPHPRPPRGDRRRTQGETPVTGKLSMWRRMRGSADIAGCREVGHILQTYLDGELDELAAPDHPPSRAVPQMRDGSRDVRKIKAALGRRGTTTVDPDAVARLRGFGQRLIEHDDQTDP